jgi:hypothetical protein
MGVLPTFRESSPSSKLLQARTHAHGMVGFLLRGFIAQQCLVLASFRLMVLFIAKAGPWAADEVMTLSPRGPEGMQTCARLKATTLFLVSRCLCR